MKAIYYRGIGTSGQRRLGQYFTQDIKEAQKYGKLVAAELTPRNPIIANSWKEIASALGVWEAWESIREGLNVLKEPSRADDLLTREAQRQGYDAFIFPDAKWMFVLDNKIIKIVKDKVSPLAT